MPSSKSTQSGKQAPISGGVTFQGPRGVRRPVQSIMNKYYILQRKDSRDAYDRTILSKTIHKQSRQEVRAWKTKWAQHLLQRF